MNTPTLAKRDWLANALIFDEAAYFRDLELFMVFTHSDHANKSMLVGDDRQLASLTFCEGSKKVWEQSKFERLINRGAPVLLLNAQYRF